MYTDPDTNIIHLYIYTYIQAHIYMQLNPDP